MKINTTYLEKIKNSRTMVRTTSKQQKLALMVFFKELGHQVSEVTFANGVVDDIDMEYPCLEWNGSRWSGNMGHTATTILFEEFFNNLFAAPVVVKVELNNEYSAVYKPGETHVTVGCQKIPVDKLNELCEKIKTANK
jgi:hypothetical protein